MRSVGERIPQGTEEESVDGGEDARVEKMLRRLGEDEQTRRSMGARAE
jgi:hypothetical protein